MKKLIIALSFFSVFTILPFSLLQACAGTFYICGDIDQFRDQFGENCLCGSTAYVIDVCTGQEYTVGGPCV